MRVLSASGDSVAAGRGLKRTYGSETFCRFLKFGVNETEHLNSNTGELSYSSGTSETA